MTLTNYWWLLIWMFTGGVLISIYAPKKKELVCGKVEERWTLLSAFLLVFPYIIWAGFRSDIFGDTYGYRKMFMEAPSSLSQLGSYINDATKDKGFSALVLIIKSVFGDSDVVFFLLIAIFQLSCIVYIYRKYSCDFWLSIFVFVAATDYMSWMHNGIRQFIAVMIVFAASELLIKKKYITVILLILLASTFHASALLMLPGIFIIQGKAWNKRTIMALGCVLIAILMIDKFTDILDMMLSETQYSNMVTDWKTWEDDGTNPIRVLVYSVPTILSVIGIKWIREEDDPMINLSVNASICATAIFIISTFTSGIFIGRLPSYFLYLGMGVLLPWEIDNMFTKESKKIIRIIAIFAYCVFFYYQMHFAWGLL